jgi:hypothetical protein
MIFDVVLWLPMKVTKHYMRPVFAMLESLSEAEPEEL